MEHNHWNDSIIHILDNIRENAIILSTNHKNRYYRYKGRAKYFKIPLIILSGVNSVISVGMQKYIDQPIISGITCIISLICAIITSIELYLGIQKTMENELLASKDFYLLAVDIYKMKTLAQEDRLVDGRAYLEDKFKTYCKLIENNDLIHKRVVDSLAPIQFKPPTSSSPIIQRLNSNGQLSELESTSTSNSNN